MSKDNKVPTIKIITPKGVAIYPHLNKPETKFNAAGVYDCRVRLDPKDKEVEALVSKLEKLRDSFYDETTAALKESGKAAKAKKLKKRDVFTDDVDADGEETGLIVLKAKTTASGTGKDGKPWKRSPLLFDAKGTKLVNAPLVYGGSEVKVAATARPYLMESSGEIGVTLYLDAVQIIKLVTGTGQSADDFGFGEEEGFEAEEAETFPEGSEGGTEGDDDKDEF